TIITAEDKQLFNHLIQTLSQFTDKTSLEEEIPRSDEIVVKPVVENTTEIKSPSVVRRSDETITTSSEEKTIKTNETTIETNVRRSGRTDRKVYTSVLKTSRDSNHVRKLKPEPKVYAIPDPESDPNSKLLLKRDNYSPKTQQYMCPNPHCRKGYIDSRKLNKHFHVAHYLKRTIICQELNCGKGFRTKQQLKCHLNNIHSDYRPFECPQKGCDFKCKTEAQLNSHTIHIHSDIYAFKCNECEKTYKTQNMLNTHLRIHSTEDTVRCRYEGCNQWFKNAKRLRKHKIAVHSAQPTWYPCEWPACGYRNESSDALKNHRRIHTGERPFECRWPACGKRFRILKGRSDHERIHSNTKNFVCHWPGCGYRCVQSANLTKHMKTIITAEDKQLFNHLIQTLSQFTDKTSLVEEIPRSNEIVVKPVVEKTTEIKSPSVVRRSDKTITTSSEEKTIKTNKKIIETNVRRSGRTDRKVYTSVLKTPRDPNHVPKPKFEPKVYAIPDPESDPNSLLLLRRDNYSPKTQQFMCPNPHCRKGFITSRKLYHHFHVVHHMKRTMVCQELNCGKSFKTKPDLNSHLRQVHSDYRPFECSQKGCDFKCKTEAQLNSHSVIHSDIYAFKCNECEKTFKSQNKLNIHLRIHSTEDTFRCRYEGCNQFFRNTFQLRRHKIVVHNAHQKWYTCEWPACGYRNKIWDALNNHRRIHTGERPYECRWPACGKRFRILKVRTDHERIHSNTKNYVCHWPGCGYRCVQSSNLTKHMIVHQNLWHIMQGNSTQEYAKDSFDRFGDDLCQLLLSYHSLDFDGASTHESVSKQFQRLIYNDIVKITIDHKLIDGYKKGHQLNDSNVELGHKFIAFLQKKCPNVRTIGYSNRYRSLQRYRPPELMIHVFRAIHQLRHEWPLLETISVNVNQLFDADHMNHQLFAYLLPTFGPMVACVVSRSDHLNQYLHLCPNLVKLEISRIELTLSSDGNHLPLFIRLKDFHFYSVDLTDAIFVTFVARYKWRLTCLRIDLIDLIAESHTVINQFMSRLSQFKDLTKLILVFRLDLSEHKDLVDIEDFNQEEVTAEPNWPAVDSIDNWPQLSHLDLYMFNGVYFEAIPQHRKLQNLRINCENITFNDQLLASLSQQSSLQSLDIYAAKVSMNCGEWELKAMVKSCRKLSSIEIAECGSTKRVHFNGQHLEIMKYPIDNNMKTPLKVSIKMGLTSVVTVVLLLPRYVKVFSLSIFVSHFREILLNISQHIIAVSTCGAYDIVVGDYTDGQSLLIGHV
ncbi:unnamed protein product, partial [Medioppia subpectinata]